MSVDDSNHGREDAEPTLFKWAGGFVALGYLGHLRWRIRRPGAVLEADNVRAAAALALESIFCDTHVGREVAERAPIRIQIGDEVSTRAGSHRR